MIYEDCKIYGPYDRKEDERQVVIIIRPDKTRTTLAYSKFLMEKHLGRYLDSEKETVDHINQDVRDNRIENLRVLPRAEHARDDAKRRKSQDFICPICKEKFTIEGRKLSDAHRNRREGKAGPFCGRSCAGKYGAEVQNKRQKKLKGAKIKREYTTLKKEKGII
jgi:hypothetical protein